MSNKSIKFRQLQVGQYFLIDCASIRGIVCKKTSPTTFRRVDGVCNFKVTLHKSYDECGSFFQPFDVDSIVPVKIRKEN